MVANEKTIIVSSGDKIVVKQFFDKGANDYIEVYLSGNEIKEINNLYLKKLNKKHNLFDAFYSNYPRKLKKSDARKKWITLKCDIDFEEIMIGLTAWKKSKDWEEETFIPHPTTFLNKKYWEDPPRMIKKKTKHTWDNVK